MVELTVSIQRTNKGASLAHFPSMGDSPKSRDILEYMLDSCMHLDNNAANDRCVENNLVFIEYNKVHLILRKL